MPFSFTFGGQDIIDDTEVNNTDLLVRSVDRPVREEITRHKIEIPGRHGSYDFGGGVRRDYNVTVNLIILAYTEEEIDTRINKIRNLLKGSKELIFSDSEIIHKAQIFESFSYDISGVGGSAEISIVFDCNAKNPQDSGTASSGTNNTLSDTLKSWDDEGNGEWEGYYVGIIDGTGIGQDRKIASNTTTGLTVEENWTTNPDNTSGYEIYEY